MTSPFFTMPVHFPAVVARFISVVLIGRPLVTFIVGRRFWCGQNRPTPGDKYNHY
jgi:hypothetical protein